MGQILFSGGGGGVVGSDDLSANASHVLAGKTYMGNDTDDDAGTGTMPNIAAIDEGVSLTLSGDKAYCRMHNGAHIHNASSGYPEVSYTLPVVRAAINYTDASKVLNDTTICGMTGTMPNIGSIDNGVSLTMGDGALWCRMHYGAHVQNASSGYPEVSYNLGTVRSAIGYNNASKVLSDTSICGMQGTMPNNTTRTSNGSVPGISSSYSSTPTREGENLQMQTDTNGVSRINICPPKGYYQGVGSSYVNRPASDFGTASAAQVLSGCTFTSTAGVKATGTMPNRGKYQYATSFGSGNDGSSDYAAFNNIPYGYYETGNDGWSPEIRIKKDFFKTSCINYFGIGSVSNFSVAQYSSLKLRFTWANPGSGKMWSGLRIVGKKDGWPSNPEDGTLKVDSANGYYITDELSAGTWYFNAWSYVTTSSERWYNNNQSGVSITNKAYGDLKFYSGATFTVPDGVTQIQYFLVGGGGGSDGNSNSNNSYDATSGGGGGYTTSGYANVTPGQTITINVGTGGSPDNSRGGTTSISGAVSATANGGNRGQTSRTSGSAGGSGGGSHGTRKYGGENGASDGGSTGTGKGQGSSTRCPWDTNSIYAGGGGGGCPTTEYTGGNGGDGGGGKGGGHCGLYVWEDAYDGEANTGGGAGGYASYAAEDYNGRTGGSGIVRIRYGW